MTNMSIINSFLVTLKCNKGKKSREGDGEEKGVRRGREGRGGDTFSVLLGPPSGPVIIRSRPHCRLPLTPLPITILLTTTTAITATVSPVS